MVKVRLVVEGGGDHNKDLNIACRRGFSKLIKSLRTTRMPRIEAAGSRQAAFKRFNALVDQISAGEHAILLVDSEDPVADHDKPGDHLNQRDGWNPPPDAGKDDVFLMTTCMETWIIADRDALQKYYGSDLKASKLPRRADLESIPRQDVLKSLVNATTKSKKQYAKGSISFEILAHVDGSRLNGKNLPGFHRFRRRMAELLDA